VGVAAGPQAAIRTVSATKIKAKFLNVFMNYSS
jgi:hypothetical protein